MLLQTRDVLKNTGYYIEYDCINNVGKILISWTKEEFNIEYDVEKQELISSFDNMIIKCPEYAAGIIANLILHEVCQDYKYGYDMCLLKFAGNPTVNFFYRDIEDEKIVDKAMALNEIYNELLTNGLQRHHIEMAIEYDLVEGLQILCNFILGVSLDFD